MRDDKLLNSNHTLRAMKSLLWGLLVFVPLALLARWYYFCEIQGTCTAASAIGAATAYAEDTTPMDKGNLALMLGDEAVLQGYEQIQFDSASYRLSLTDNNRLFLERVQAYLTEHPESNLSVEGRYLPSERTADPGIYNDIGVARANAIIGELVTEPTLPRTRFAPDTELVEGDTLADGAVGFRLFDNPAYAPPAATDTALASRGVEGVAPDSEPQFYIQNGERLRIKKFDFLNNTFLDSNFESNSADFKPSKGFRNYADSLVTYLSTRPEASLTIVGHTDSKGSDNYNDRLGLQRARSARTYLRDKGINNDITVQSKGKREPVETNTTEGGRAANRRIGIIVQQ